MSHDPWSRHRALERVREAWPELAGEQPPARERLAAALARAQLDWQLSSSSTGSYEAAVVAGQIPTREGSWHDTFNVLAFIAFPHSKAALHRRCWTLQQARERRPPRSREEDALTLIDETALLFAGSAAAIERVAAARELATDDRLRQLEVIVREHDMHVHVFGHALLEHLALGRPQIGAGVLTLALDGPLTRARIDAALAQRIREGGFPRPQLSPTVPWPDPQVEAWLRPHAPE